MVMFTLSVLNGSILFMRNLFQKIKIAGDVMF